MRPIYFLHIPKTSGTSVNSAIEKTIGSENMFKFKTWGYINLEEDKMSIASDLYTDKYKFITGHFSWNEKIVGKRYIFSMFRNPISRTISQLQHIYKYRPNPIWSNNEYDFSNGLLSSIFIPNLAKYISNVQSKYLLGNVDMIEQLKVTDRNEFIFLEDDLRFQKNTDLFKPLLYILLLYKLLKLNNFGLQEFHQESLILLSNSIGIPLINMNIKENISEINSDTYTPTPEELKQLRKINNYDLFLYSIAKRLFIRRWLRYINTKLNLKLDLNSYLKDREKYLSMLIK